MNVLAHAKLIRLLARRYAPYWYDPEDFAQDVYLATLISPYDPARIADIPRPEEFYLLLVARSLRKTLFRKSLANERDREVSACAAEGDELPEQTIMPDQFERILLREIAEELEDPPVGGSGDAHRHEAARYIIEQAMGSDTAIAQAIRGSVFYLRQRLASKFECYPGRPSKRKRVRQKTTARDVMVEIDGQLVPLAAAARMRGLSITTVRDRILNYGWPAQRAVDTPSAGRGGTGKGRPRLAA